ncbi:MAG: hypothetical protein QGG38_03825 [Nitrospinaceae bacterium]|nr:hypothetical protein [Nitrospinaceae bacterium]
MRIASNAASFKISWPDDFARINFASSPSYPKVKETMGIPSMPHLRANLG